MEIKITIKFDHWPDKALFPNKAGNTLHWAQRSALRKAAKEEAYLLCMDKRAGWSVSEYSKFPLWPAKIEILVKAKDKRRRDLDGFLSACKPWIDGIVLARFFEDDNYFDLPEISIRFEGVSTESVSIIVTETS